MPTKTIKLKIPATSANMGSGFDALGIALDLYNEIEVTVKPGKNRLIKISIEGEGKDVLPRDKNNIVYQAMENVLKRYYIARDDLFIKLVNNIPLARGLGSSAAARVGGLVAANIICGNKLKQQDIINIATELEGHPDNVVPALIGGLCVTCMVNGKVEFVKIPPPKDIKFIICIPEFQVSTDKARKILPKSVDFEDAVFNIQRVSILLASLMTKRYDLLFLATEDKLHQPYRRKLIPGLEDVFKAAKDNGSLGVYLSGSGPSIAVMIDCNARNTKIGNKMCNVFEKLGIKCRYKILSSNTDGIEIS